MNPIILEMKDGSFSYENNRTAMEHMNVSIRQGEKIAVIGNNGAGKSTFFLSLTGVLHLNQGEIFLQGERIEYKKKDLLKLRKQIGMVFQDPDHQIIASTVQAEISFGLFNLGQPKEEIQTQVNNMMEEMNLTSYADRPPHFLSGGEKKRVSIADILVMDPAIILFDEPTASLDCKNIQLLKECLDKLHDENKTILISTHDMNLVWEWADRVLVFSDGQLIADDSPAVIFGMDEILKKAALQKPILYELSEQLFGEKGLNNSEFPKSIEEFRELYIR